MMIYGDNSEQTYDINVLIYQTETYCTFCFTVVILIQDNKHSDTTKTISQLKQVVSFIK